MSGSGEGGGQIVISAYLVRGVDGVCIVCDEVRAEGVLLTREKGRVGAVMGAGSCFSPFCEVGDSVML
jgi:hypothetical protein